MDAQTRYKDAAVEQWTADPCEGRSADGLPGSREHLERLVAARAAYGPWLDEALDYEGSQGLAVLDVGCGQGIDLVKHATAGARVTGVDLTPRHVELAQAHIAAAGLHARVLIGDAESLPLPDQAFDRVSSNGVLHHTPDMPMALREIHRVLRPGGEIRVLVYNRWSLHYWLNQVLYEGLWRRRLFSEGSMREVLSGGVEHSSVGARPLVRVYGARELSGLLRSAGFIDTACFTWHFQLEDAFPVALLARVLPVLRDPRVQERIGRRAGWYVLGRGVKADV